jgi:heme-degrading monooxygenase HmoA
MIAREWRGVVRPGDADAYLEYLERTGLADYASTPGHRGTLVLRSPVPDGIEFTLITFWESVEAVRGFAGDDPLRARYYPDDARFLLAQPERVRHYDVTRATRIG